MVERRWPRLSATTRREIVLALALLFCYGFFRQVPAWNEYSRYDLVRALVDDRTTSIDPYQGNTGDKSYYNGHYYSDKTPGSALMGVPAYLLLSASYVATGAGTPDPVATVQALAFVASGIPTVLLILLLLRFLRPAVGEPWALVVSLGYGLGSIAFPFATMYFGHAASAFFLFAAFYLLWRARALERPGRRYVLAGFLAGCAVVVEISALLGVLVLLGYALSDGRPTERRLRRLRWRGPTLMVAGALVPAATLLAYDWLSFGSPFSLGYSNLTSGAFAQGMGQGILGVTWPKLDVLVDLLVGTRGILRLAPWLVVAPLGLLALRRRDLRREVLVCLAIVVVFLLFNAGYYLPFGGWTPGPRFLTPALPFAAVLVALVPRGLRPLVALLIAVGAAVFLVATATMPNAPELYTDPLTQLWLPRLLDRNLAETVAWLRWGLHGIEPLLAVVLGLAVAGAALLATYRTDAPGRRLATILTGGLVVLVVAFAIPLAPARAISVGPGGRSADPNEAVAIVDAGATPQLVHDARSMGLWVQAENQGPALAGTRIVFTVFAPDGRAIWSGWFDGVDWGAGERKRSTIDWDITKTPPGDYRVGVAVESKDGTVVYAPIRDAGVVHVGP